MAPTTEEIIRAAIERRKIKQGNAAIESKGLQHITSEKMRAKLFELRAEAATHEKSYARCKQLVLEIMEIGRAEGIVDMQIRAIIDKSLEDIVSERSIQRYIPKELRKIDYPDARTSPILANSPPENQLEERNNEIIEPEDERSELDIQEEVNKSLGQQQQQQQKEPDTNLSNLIKQQEREIQSLQEDLKNEIQKHVDYQQLKEAVAKQTFHRASETSADLATKVQQLEADMKTIMQERDDYEKQYKDAVARLEQYGKLDPNHTLEFSPKGFLNMIHLAAMKGEVLKIHHDGYKVIKVVKK